MVSLNQSNETRLTWKLNFFIEFLSRFEWLRWAWLKSVVVARDQHEDMPLSLDVVHTDTGRDAEAGNFAALIDVIGVAQVQRRVGRNQGVQVDHGAALLPQER